MSRLHRDVLVSLIESIERGELEPGTLLPREEDLAARFDVSRGVTREALRALEERGVVTVKHGRGATVRPPVEWDVLDPDVLAVRMTGSESQHVVEESIEACMIVEPEAAALAAERADDDERSELAGALDSMSAAAVRSRVSSGAQADFRDAELSFHRSLLRASGNATLARVAEPIERALEMARPPRPMSRARFERGLEGRRRIAEAVERHDPDEAREAMRAHLETLAQELRESTEGRS